MSNGWSLERRERQREVAKKLVEEGRFGGKGRGQGRPRKKRASEVVAERVSDEGNDIFERLMEITRGGADANSIAAARTLLDTEEKERKLQIEEEQQLEEMRGHDLAELIFGQLLELNETGTFDIPFDIEGEFVEIAEESTDRVSEESENSVGRT